VKTQITAICFMLKALELSDELKIFSAYVFLMYADRGQNVPEDITEVLGIPTAVKEKKSASVSPAALKKGSSRPEVIVSTTTSVTAPARTLGPDTLLGYLKNIVDGIYIDWAIVQEAAGKFFRTGGCLVNGGWDTLVSAMKIVDAKGGYILPADVVQAVFGKMPANLLSDLLFGQDGLVLSACKALEIPGGKMPYARLSTLLKATESLNLNHGLDDQENHVFGRFLSGLRKKNAPQDLIEDGENLFTKIRRPETPALAVALSKAVVVTHKINGNGKVNKAVAPEATVAPVAEPTASEETIPETASADTALVEETPTEVEPTQEREAELAGVA
jgi:hypothetical protein